MIPQGAHETDDACLNRYMDAKASESAAYYLAHKYDIITDDANAARFTETMSAEDRLALKWTLVAEGRASWLMGDPSEKSA